MNLFLLTPEDRVSHASDSVDPCELFRLPARQAEHARKVLRVTIGDTVKVGLHHGPMGTGTVVSAPQEGEVWLSVLWAETRAPQPSFELWLAIPRPKVLARILRDAATLGVREIVLFRSARVDKSYLESPLLTPALYRPLLQTGLMQARTTYEPTVHIEPLFRPFFEDRASARIGHRNAYMVHPDAAYSLAALCGAASSVDAIVAIGPEGGYVPFEIALATAHGLQTAHLGPRILRVETAVAAALTLLGATR